MLDRFPGRFFGRLPGRFAGDRNGATAIEFTMLAIPFCLLVFAILESCISFAGQEVMANATDDIARQLRTGQIKTINKTTLKQDICDRLKIMVSNNCMQRVMVDLRQYDTFEQAAAAKFKISDGAVVLTKGTANDPKQFVVEPGSAKTRNMLRVFYKWPVMTDFMSKTMANLNDGDTLHYASVTWQNEPYDDE